RLGKGGSRDRIKKLPGESRRWQEEKDSRFRKLNNFVVKGFEDYKERPLFAPGGAGAVMDDLVRQADRLGELWSDPKCTYLLVFGREREGRFLWPGEDPLVVGYFRARLRETLEKGRKGTCPHCDAADTPLLNLDKTFPFATFDKKSFLPGVESNASAQAKVLPLCKSCLAVYTRGRQAMDGRFTVYKPVFDLRLSVIPELLGSKGLPRALAKGTEEFLSRGVNEEETFFSLLAEQEEALVYHFLFWEQNQAQERVHLMVEDVPPSRLKRLTARWNEAEAVWGLRRQEESGKPMTLDQGLASTLWSIADLAGASDQDRLWFRQQALSVLGRLLGGETVNVSFVKQLFVSRIPGRFADEKWMQYGAVNMRRLAAVLDFLTLTNER
ncbi:MAG: TM1802 family CRISPR-associated protein, partial [Synergistales bacterium]|nr:TM1802 family CRISPR-associated protein [Synergistales bacterium]